MTENVMVHAIRLKNDLMNTCMIELVRWFSRGVVDSSSDLGDHFWGVWWRCPENLRWRTFCLRDWPRHPGLGVQRTLCRFLAVGKLVPVDQDTRWRSQKMSLFFWPRGSLPLPDLWVPSVWHPAFIQEIKNARIEYELLHLMHWHNISNCITKYICR